MIAFVVGDSYDGASIWTVPVDGHGAAKLIGPDDRCRLGVAFPSYSHDGRKLIYSCQDGTSGTSPDVHETLEILDLASGERSSVVTLRGQDELVWPTWSRDGTTAVVTVNTWAEDLTTQTGSVHRDGPHLRRSDHASHEGRQLGDRWALEPDR